jgi:SAM-dependent methyltransferase
MPIRTTIIERFAIFNLNIGPGPLFDIFGAIGFRLALAAVRLELFEALKGGPLTAAEVARRVDADERGITMLLPALESLGYVKKRGERYSNAAMTSKWLLESSPSNFAPYFRYWGTVLSKLEGNWEGSLRSGQPPTNLYEWIEGQPETSRDFQEAMVAIAKTEAGEIARKVKLPPGATRLLDVGGGHAMYSIEMCRRYPQLSVTVLDSPQALQAARANIDSALLSSRISTQEGDLRFDDLGSDYDAALVFNIMHGLLPEENARLFRKIRSALRPGGQLVILEQLADKAPTPMATAIVRMLGASYYSLLGGHVYTFRQIARQLREAGFSGVRRKNLLTAPGSSLVIGTLRG